MKSPITPKKKTTSRKKKTVSPKKKTVSPKKKTTTPLKKTTSPKKPPGSLEKKSSNTEEKKILDEILNIQIPGNYYPGKKLVLKDLVKQQDAGLILEITKGLYGFVEKIGLGSSSIAFTFIKIIALIASTAIPFPEVRTFIISKTLAIIKTAKSTANLVFAEIYLKLFDKKLSTVSYYKKLSFAVVLPVVVGSFYLFTRTGKQESIVGFLEDSYKKALSKNYSPFFTETSEITGETNKFLISEKIIKEGETKLKLEKLGIDNPEISKLNPKGVGITYNPILGTDKPINLRFIARVPYLDNSEKFLSGDVGLVKNSKDIESIKEKLTYLVKFYEENLGGISSWYTTIQRITGLAKRYDDLIRTINFTVEDMKRNGEPVLKIQIYEDLGEQILTEGLQKKSLSIKYDLPEQAISNFIELKDITSQLLLSGINISNQNNRQKILEASRTPQFVNTLRSNLNIINDTRKKLLEANRDIKSSNLKNINLVSLRVDDATSVIASAINRIKKYNTSNPLEFYSNTIEPVVIESSKTFIRTPAQKLAANQFK
jgi:hypothetical protein